ncbi:extracellular solute-binding protein [Paenibacillus eucommiae]|uniref:Aldouronate transport system substrate-binding protein n=1 Tax=Paenibacillus eucommiae TaxID=1355755 RepID=A0ABS4J1Z2_9BACL|nr:extracellular solute-binding protein [Paenibacillus eucommiae]MBP1993810.1 putative aldouronate transport system substrate-binding protein [Paenibacillus eucommiae]
MVRGFSRSKRAFSLLLVVILMVVIALSACSSSNSGTDAGSGKTTDAGGNTSSASGEKGKEGDGSPVELTMFVDFPWLAVDQFEGPIPEEITKKTGVKLKIIKASTAEQLQVLIGSGDLPDIIYSDRLPDRLATPEVSYAWDELIAQYAPDFKIDAIEIANNTVADGHFYTIRNNFATEEQWKNNKYAMPGGGIRSISVREDILEKLGNPPIDTLDDFEQVLGMVKKQFPDMIPHLLSEGGTSHLALAQEFGLDAGSNIYERDGKVEYFLSHPALLDTLKYMNKLLRSGYIDPENFAYSSNKVIEMQKNPKVFSFGRSTLDPYMINEQMKKSGQEMKYKTLHALSDKAVVMDGGIGWAGTYITKKNKNPEKSIQFLQFMKSEEGQRLSTWGIEGTHWTLAPEGYPILNKEYAEEHKDTENWMRKYGIGWFLGMSAITDGLINYDPGRPELMERFQEIKKITKYRPDLYLTLPPADTEERTIYNKLNELFTNENPKIILSSSEEEFTKAFNDLLSRAESIGMSKLNQWLTENYKEIAKKYKK